MVTPGHRAREVSVRSLLQFQPLSIVHLRTGSRWALEGLSLLFASTPMFQVDGAAPEESAAVVRMSGCVLESFLCAAGGDDRVMQVARNYLSMNGAASVRAKAR
jgi:hypothetical protein